MKYFVLANDPGEDSSRPAFINGTLHARFDRSLFKKGVDYGWNGAADAVRSNPLSFPDKLFLICAHKHLAFDVHHAHSGLIVSQRFVDLLDDGDRQAFRIATLHVVDRDGASIVDTAMFFMKFISILYILDLKRSIWIQTKLAGNLLSNPQTGRPAIAAVKTAIIDESIILGRHIFSSPDLVQGNAIVSESLKDKMQSENISGVEYWSLERYHELGVIRYGYHEIERRNGEL